MHINPQNQETWPVRSDSKWKSSTRHWVHSTMYTFPVQRQTVEIGFLSSTMTETEVPHCAYILRYSANFKRKARGFSPQSRFSCFGEHTVKCLLYASWEAEREMLAPQNPIQGHATQLYTFSFKSFLLSFYLFSGGDRTLTMSPFKMLFIGRHECSGQKKTCNHQAVFVPCGCQRQNSGYQAWR